MGRVIETRIYRVSMRYKGDTSLFELTGDSCAVNHRGDLMLYQGQRLIAAFAAGLWMCVEEGKPKELR